MTDRLIYRLKPARTEAIQLTGFNEKDIDFFCGPENAYCYSDCVEKDYKFAKIRCYDGIRTAQIGDWLIRGIDGEIYILKDNTFRALFTYEKTLHSF